MKTHPTETTETADMHEFCLHLDHASAYQEMRKHAQKLERELNHKSSILENICGEVNSQIHRELDNAWIERDELRERLEREKLIADRLADALTGTLKGWIMPPGSKIPALALAAWKELRK
jgi:hypothetical protein